MITEIGTILGIWQFAYWKKFWHVRIVHIYWSHTKKVGKRNGANLRGASRWAWKEAQIQNHRKIRRHNRRPIKSCRRIHTNMGCQRQGTHGQSHELRLAFQHKLHASNLRFPPPTRNFLRIRAASAKDPFSAFFRFEHRWYLLFISAYFKFFILSGLL